MATMSENAQKALSGKVGPLSPNRRDHLKAYLWACVRDNVLTRGDLVSLNTVEKIRQTVTDDLKAMLTDAGAGLTTGLKNLACMFLGAKTQ